MLFCDYVCPVASVMSNSFATPRTVACLAALPMEFSKQEYRNWLPFPTPGNRPNAGIKLAFLASCALADRFFTTILFLGVHKKH